jgi:hypothetical protein
MARRHSKPRDRGSGQKRRQQQASWRGPSVQTFFRIGVGEALAELLMDGQQFPELFGFLAKAGNAQAVLPLIQALQQPKSNRYEALVALSAIAHRIGHEALVAQLTEAMADDPSRAAELADSLLARPADEAETYFGGMFRGPSPEDFAQSLASLARR